MRRAAQRLNRSVIAAGLCGGVVGNDHRNLRGRGAFCRCEMSSPCVSPWTAAYQAGWVDEIPDGLVRALQDGHCVAVVGAGLSIPAGLPGFEALLKQVASASSVSLALPDRGGYDELDRVQSCLADLVGREKMCSLMLELLRSPQPLPAKAEAVISAFVQVPFSSVVSWNWDELLDHSFVLVPHNAQGYERVLTSDASSPLETPLVKMQGNLRDPQSVVLTQADYRRRDLEALTFLQRLYSSRVVLYVGLSLRTTGVERYFPGPGGSHYAILNDVSEEQKADLLRNFGIQVISYDSVATDFQGNALVLEELARRVCPRCE